MGCHVEWQLLQLLYGSIAFVYIKVYLYPPPPPPPQKKKKDIYIYMYRRVKRTHFRSPQHQHSEKKRKIIYQLNNTLKSCKNTSESMGLRELQGRLQHTCCIFCRGLRELFWYSLLSDPFNTVNLKCIFLYLLNWLWISMQWITEMCLFHISKNIWGLYFFFKSYDVIKIKKLIVTWAFDWKLKFSH